MEHRHTGLQGCGSNHRYPSRARAARSPKLRPPEHRHWSHPPSSLASTDSTRSPEHHALRGGRHGVFRRGGSTEDVYAGGLEHVDEVCPGFDRHALAQSGAEFDLAAFFMPKTSLIRNGTPRTVHCPAALSSSPSMQSSGRFQTASMTGFPALIAPSAVAPARAMTRLSSPRVRPVLGDRALRTPRDLWKPFPNLVHNITCRALRRGAWRAVG